MTATVTCPWCGTVFTFVLGVLPKTGRRQCSDCGKLFDVYRRKTVTYSAERVEGE